MCILTIAITISKGKFGCWSLYPNILSKALAQCINYTINLLTVIRSLCLQRPLAKYTKQGYIWLGTEVSAEYHENIFGKSTNDLFQSLGKSTTVAKKSSYTPSERCRTTAIYLPKNRDLEMENRVTNFWSIPLRIMPL